MWHDLTYIFTGWEQAEGKQIQEQGKQLGSIAITENAVAWVRLVAVVVVRGGQSLDTF